MKLAKLTVILAIIALASCASKPAPQAVTAADVAPAQPGEVVGAGMRVEARQSTIIDWYARDDGEVAQPEWLQAIRRGNEGPIRQQWSSQVGDNYIYFSTAAHRDRQIARINAGLAAAAKLAFEFRQKIVAAASGTIQSEDNQRALEEITRAIKLDAAGGRQFTEFWRLIRTRDRGVETEQYVYFVFFVMQNNIYQEQLEKYVRDCIGVLPPSREKQNMMLAFADLEREQNIQEERSEAEFQQQLQLQLEAARADNQRQMAQINRGAARDESMARVAQSQVEAQGAAQSAANRFGTAAQSAISATTGADLDWISALAADAAAMTF